jgi:hypothetical protein
MYRVLFFLRVSSDNKTITLTTSPPWHQKLIDLLRQRAVHSWLVWIVLAMTLLVAACTNNSSPDTLPRAVSAAESASTPVSIAQRSTPIPTRTPLPTFTPTPEDIRPLIIITPPRGETPGVVIVPPGMEAQVILPTPVPPVPPTETPTFTPLPPPDTPTPFPTETPTFTPTPTPYVEIQGGLITLRSGPGVNYPSVAQLGPDIPVAIVGRTSDGVWFRICCVNGQDVWVAAQHVIVFNDITQVPLVNALEPPPTPTWTPTPTETPTPTPILYPFERAIGPQFFPTNNPFLTIWVKLFVGELGNPQAPEAPAEGYFLEVEFEGFDRPNRLSDIPSWDEFHFSASPGAGNRVEYNLKYEYHPYNPPRASYPGATPTPTALELLGTGTWTVWIKDGMGNQLSEKVTFTTQPFNPNREIYIGWRRVR